MRVFNEIQPLKAFLKGKSTGSSVGLVPTMGALHAGHLSLVAAARAENKLTVVSIFVNPAQFNNPTDLEKYPRTLQDDIRLLEGAGCDVLFAPAVTEMYQSPARVQFDFGPLGQTLEGASRPGHFSGVALVVAKLFHLVQPDVAYFGQKDFQQYKVIEQLVSDLNFNLRLRRMPIYREPDGLAMSSRNARLTPAQRPRAVVFYEALQMAKEMLAKREPLERVQTAVRKKCEAETDVRLDYLALVSAANLMPQRTVTSDSVLLIAGWVGEIRLIDNLLITE